MSKVIPIGGNGLRLPAHVRKQHPSGQVRLLRSMVIAANPEKRQVLLAFPEMQVGYVIPSASSLRNFIEKLTALERELFDESGKNMAQAIHKDKLDFAQKTP